MAIRDDIAKRAARRKAIEEAEAVPTDLAARLARGRDLKRRIRWPGTDVELDVVPLSYAMRAEAVAATIEALRQRGIDGGDPAPEMVNHTASEHIVQILARALLDPVTGEPAFKSATELGHLATEDEISVLWSAYSDHRQSVDPEIKELPAAEVESFLDAAKKKDWERGRAIASSWPKSWLLTLVDQLARSVTSSSTSTPSLEESTSSDSAPAEPESPSDS